jgi:hypothetical protein
MESTGNLDPNDDIQLWCLHLVFLPLINKHISSWQEAWVLHPLRSEINKTSIQLWIAGLHAISYQNIVQFDKPFHGT